MGGGMTCCSHWHSNPPDGSCHRVAREFAVHPRVYPPAGKRLVAAALDDAARSSTSTSPRGESCTAGAPPRSSSARDNSASAFCRRASVSASMALVASSRITRRGSAKQRAGEADELALAAAEAAAALADLVWSPAAAARRGRGSRAARDRRALRPRSPPVG